MRPSQKGAQCSQHRRGLQDVKRGCAVLMQFRFRNAPFTCRLSTKSVDNSVDELNNSNSKSLQIYDIVKLAIFSPVHFHLYFQ